MRSGARVKGNYSDAMVIIPTLNERANIGRVVGALTRLYSGINVIVTDDGSSDGTRELVSGLGERNKRVKLLDREHRSVHGVTASILDTALIAKGSKIIVMDGDTQHPPEKVGEIARALDRYDIVVATRVRVRNWGWHRIIMSRGMEYLSRLSFAMKGKKTCHDMMSGFFGVNAHMLRHMIRSRRSEFVEDGYKILLDVLRMADSGAMLGEVPYSTFHFRKEGRSKFGLRHVFTTLRSALR